MIQIIPHKATWRQEFEQLGRELTATLGNLIEGVHHIGSTSVPGLAAKDVIDIQISVNDFELVLVEQLSTLGYRQLEHIKSDHRPPGMEHLPEADLYKWFFQKDDRAVNLHVRKVGTFNHRYALLCRDYLRSNTAAAKAYEAVKVNLGRYFPQDMTAYYHIKDPVFDVLMAGAEIWAAGENWQPEKLDIIS
ncbi:GrpB family protein [Pedobacter sp. SYSU D00535]|uniref:GrpB family protein n=1 Tax=Pedobacter sp. SYSU D00535 TaxID=2810308 RepID=UPI001A96DEED|nr:GrpB family protein [Pedobacter sp. SYSU D00535]